MPGYWKYYRLYEFPEQQACNSGAAASQYFTNPYLFCAFFGYKMGKANEAEYRNNYGNTGIDSE